MKAGEDYVGLSVVFYCHDGKGSVLMNKRSTNCRDEHGKWDIGGGRVEVEDNIEKTLHNEISQEYQTYVREYEFLGFREIFRRNAEKTTHWVTLDFKVLVDPENWGNGEPHKFDDVKWVKHGEWPESVHSQLPKFLRLYEKRLVQS